MGEDFPDLKRLTEDFPKADENSFVPQRCGSLDGNELQKEEKQDTCQRTDVQSRESIWVARDSPAIKRMGNGLRSGVRSTVFAIKCWAEKLRFHQTGCKNPLSSPQWRRENKCDNSLDGSLHNGLQRRLEINNQPGRRAGGQFSWSHSTVMSGSQLRISEKIKLQVLKVGVA